MAQIEGIRIQNFRALRDVTLGCLWNTQGRDPLTPLVAVIGKNGSGKSTIFDAFGFLRDALQVGVEEACDLKQRGGFHRLKSAGTNGPISFELYYREAPKERPITYELKIGLDSRQRPVVIEERLRQRRKGQKHGRPYSFLNLSNGEGRVWSGPDNLSSHEDPDSVSQEDPGSTEVRLTDPRKLGIATLGSLREHSRIAQFQSFLENWYLSYFSPDAARSLPLAGPQRHLNLHGDNLGNVVQFMEREHGATFEKIRARIAQRIPGVSKIDTKTTDDGRVLLRFNDSAFQDPFLAQQVSDGTLKVFAYLLLLEDPDPPPFICIEEPENGLYHKLLDILAKEFREHARKKTKASQLFITTHQPYFVDALLPEEVWIISKQPDGYSTVSRASDDPLVRNLVEQELPLGGLWYSDYLDKR
jgi:predicted ATPase